MKDPSSSRSRLSFSLFGVPSPFDPTCTLVTSSLPFLHPSVFGAIRALFALYTLVVCVVILIFEAAVYGRGPT